MVTANEIMEIMATDLAQDYADGLLTLEERDAIHGAILRAKRKVQELEDTRFEAILDFFEGAEVLT